MTTVMLKITYKNGTKIRHMVYYVAVENGNLWFSVARQVNYGFAQAIRIPLENIASFEVEQVEPCFDSDRYELEVAAR